MKETQQKKPKKGIFLKIAAIGFAVYALISMISTQAQINEMNEKVEEIKEEYTANLIRNEELQRTVDSHGTDAFIEEQAREKLGYAYPEEHFYIDVSGTN